MAKRRIIRYTVTLLVGSSQINIIIWSSTGRAASGAFYIIILWEMNDIMIFVGICKNIEYVYNHLMYNHGINSVIVDFVELLKHTMVSEFCAWL